MEAEWPGAEFHCPSHRPGMQHVVCFLSLRLSGFTHNILIDVQM